MARIARSSALIVLPSHVPLIPGTCDRVIAITQRRELLSDFSVLRLKTEMRFDPLVSLLQHIGTRSAAKVRAGGQLLKKRPSP
jgi:hypothetical protein